MIARRPVRLTKRQQPERAVQRAVKELFERVGGRVWTIGTVRGKDDAHKGTRMSPGIPDLWIAMPFQRRLLSGPACEASIRQGLWFECKSARGRQSDEQKDFQSWCERADVPYLIGGIDVAIAYLRKGGWLKPDHGSLTPEAR